MSRIAKFSVKNPVLVNLLMIVIFIAGYLSFQSMNREVFPEVSVDLVTVVTTYPGSAPREMEQLISIPIENEIADIDGIQRIESSSVEGRSVVVIELIPNHPNPKNVMFDIQSEVDSISELPENADDPEVELITTNFPVITVGLSGNLSEDQLYVKADRLEDQFRTIPGVNDVQTRGRRDRKIWVDVDPVRARHYGVYLTDLQDSLRESSLNRPGGTLTGNLKESLVRTISEARLASEIRTRTARASDIRPVTMADLARVYPGFEEWQTRGHVDGKTSLSMTLFKQAEADSIRIVENLRKKVKEINASRSDLNLTLYNDSTVFIKNRINTLTESAQLALVLILCVLFITLNARIAIITALGLPVSIFGSLIVMEYFGLSINMLSLFGVIIVLGIIVDDAIVVTENIFRHMEDGMPPQKAAVTGTNQVLWPVIATIATNVAAFIPLYMIGGTTGKFMAIIPTAVIVTLLISLVEALVILPSHMADFVRSDETQTSSWRERWIRPIRQSFTALASTAIRFRYMALVLFLLAGGSSLFLATMIPVKFFPLEDIQEFKINFEAPQGSALSYTESLISEIEKEIEKLPDEEIKSYVTSIGWIRGERGDFQFATDKAQIQVELVDPQNRTRTGREIINQLRQEVLPFPMAKRVEFIEQQAGPPRGKDLELEIAGDNTSQLKTLADSVVFKLESIAKTVAEETDRPDEQPVFNIRHDYAGGKTEVRVEPIPQKTGEYNVSHQLLARMVTGATDGLEAATFQDQREEIEIMVRMSPAFLSDPSRLTQLRIPLPSGSWIPLDQLATIHRVNSPAQINRVNRMQTITASASVDDEIITTRELIQRLQPTIDRLKKQNRDIQFRYGGEFEEQTQAYGDLGRAFLLAVLTIFTILAGLFNSVLKPLIILAALPFSLVGVFIGLYVMGHAISFPAAMGAVALAGIVVNDALILVSFIEEMDVENNSRFTAVLRSIRQRFRPVLLTTVTTIAGLIPIAFQIGLSGLEAFLSPMAVALVYGLAFGSILTLIFVPVLYVIADEIIRKIKNLFAGLIS